MTPVSPKKDVIPGGQSVHVSYWRSAIFAPLGDGQRRRRGSDAVRLTLALIAVLCAALVVRAVESACRTGRRKGIEPPPQGIKWLVDVCWVGGSFGTVALLLLLALIWRRWNILRDLASAAVGTLAVTGVLVLVLGQDERPARCAELGGLQLELPGAQHRGGGGGGYRLSSLPGTRRPAPDRVRVGVRCRGNDGRRAWPAGQCARKHGHRLGGHRSRPPRLRVATGPPVG